MKNKFLKIKKILRKNLRWFILFICTLFFLETTEKVFAQEIMRRDVMGYKLISTYLISDYITPIAKFITQFGGAICLIFIATILFIVIKNKKIGICIYLNLLLVTILNLTLKNIVQRPRPTEYRMINELGYSFPSGHSMASAAFYGFLIYLIYKKIENKKLKIILISLLSLLILLIGVSRIYLGVHYTSDVFGGFCVSISYLAIFTNVVNDLVNTKD